MSCPKLVVLWLVSAQQLYRVIEWEIQRW